MSIYYYIYNGETSSGLELNNDARMEIFSGGMAIDTTVNTGCQVTVYSGGTANRTEVYSGGRLTVYSGGTATNVDWSPLSGGILYLEFGAYVTLTSGFSGVYYSGSHANEIKDISLTNRGNDIYVMSGGTAVNTTVRNEAGLKIYDGALASSVTASYGKVCVYSGGSADKVNMHGSFELHSGGTLTNLTITYDSFDICVAPDTYLQGTRAGKDFKMENGLISGFVYSDGNLHVSRGGIVDAATIGGGKSEVDYANLIVYDGGLASRTIAVEESYVIVSSGGTALDTTLGSGAFMAVYNGGSAVDILVQSRGNCHVRSGGVVDNMTVESRGYVYVSTGGVAKNTVLTNSDCYFYIESGGTLTGRMRTEEGAIVSAYSGAVIDFSLAGLSAGDDALLDDWSRIKGKENALYTLTVNAGQSAGIYSLADGAAGFNKTITVKSESGENLGTLWLNDDPKKIKRRLYSASVTDGCLTLTVEAIAPENCPDNGWNDYVYDKKREKRKPPEPALNPYRYDLNEFSLDSETEEIILDREDTIDKDGKYNFVGKVDGVEDAADFARIYLSTGANLSFNIESTAGGKFVIYQLVRGMDKKGNITYSMKTVQTTALKKAKGETEYSANSKRKLLAAGEYYVAMQGTIAKKGDTEGYYNVLLNDPENIFYTDGDGGWNNYLYDSKTKNPNPERYYFMTTTINSGTSGVVLDSGVSHADETGTWKNFAGFGDDTDFGRFHLNHAASLSFTVKATDASKITVWRLDEKEDKKGNIVYTQKSLQATTLKKAKGETLYTADTKSLLLEAGEYYISVQSTNAAKGGSAYYNVEVNQPACTYYDYGDSGWNNWLYDKKRTYEPLNSSIYFSSGQTIDAGTTSVYVDGESIDHEEYGIIWDGFVGFGDSADFLKIRLNSDAALSFTLQATDATKFTIWRLDEKEDKKGNIVYTQKSLQATTLKKAKGATLYEAETKALSLEAGTYYVSMESTNASKGGCAFYNVAVNGMSSFSESEPASALEMPIAAAAYADSVQDKPLGESGNGLLASL